MTTSQDAGLLPHAGRALAESEARYKALVAATTQFVWRRGAHNVADDATDAWWETLTGQAPDRANGEYGWGWLEQLHADDREHARAAWVNAFSSRALFDTEYRIRARDGAYRHFAVRGVPVGDDPTAQEWIGTFTDITTVREAEAERLRLLEAEREARTAAERAAQHAARMASAASAFNAASTVRDATAVLLSESRSAVAADAGLVAMLDASADEVELVDSVG